MTAKVEAMRTSKIDFGEMSLDELVSHIGEYQRRRGAVVEGGSPIAGKMIIGRLPLSVEAALVAKLRKDGRTQGEVAEMLDASRSHVVRLEQLSSLSAPLRRRLFSGKLRVSTALALSRLPAEEQMGYAGMDRITLREVRSRLREEKMSKIDLSSVRTPKEGGGAFGEFADAMREKFYAKLAMDRTRSPIPWVDYDAEFLRSRLKEEIEEYFESGEKGELIDIANFCMFLFKKEKVSQP